MDNQHNTPLSKPYFFSVLLLMVILPILCCLIEIWTKPEPGTIMYLIGKWFTFWAIGLRLFTAGFKQVTNPAFTAKSIFHLKSPDSLIIVRELGFANLCLGATGILSLFMPTWRMAAAFSGGLYFGIAGINHLIKKPVSANEWLALVSDIFIFLVALTYLINAV